MTSLHRTVHSTQAIPVLSSYPDIVNLIPGIFIVTRETDGEYRYFKTSGTKLLRVRSGVRLIIQPFFATKHWHLVAKVVRRNILKIHVNAYLRLTIPTLRSIRIWMIDIHHSLNYIRENAESRVSIGISTTEVA